MAAPKGHPRYGGRRKGTPNKRTTELQAEVVKSGKSPLEHMLAVLHDESADKDRRDRMAIAAAPFVHPRLAVVDSRVVAEVKVSPLTDEQRREQARALIRAAFAERTPLVVDAEYKVIAGKDNLDALPALNDKTMKSDT